MVGESGEGKNITHQQKSSMNRLKEFRTVLIFYPDDKVAQAPFTSRRKILWKCNTCMNAATLSGICPATHLQQSLNPVGRNF